MAVFTRAIEIILYTTADNNVAVNSSPPYVCNEKHDWEHPKFKIANARYWSRIRRSHRQSQHLKARAELIHK